jgi:hypothetical protein
MGYSELLNSGRRFCVHSAGDELQDWREGIRALTRKVPAIHFLQRGFDHIPVSFEQMPRQVSSVTLQTLRSTPEQSCILHRICVRPCIRNALTVHNGFFVESEQGDTYWEIVFFVRCHVVLRMLAFAAVEIVSPAASMGSTNANRGGDWRRHLSVRALRRAYLLSAWSFTVSKMRASRSDWYPLSKRMPAS